MVQKTSNNYRAALSLTVLFEDLLLFFCNLKHRYRNASKVELFFSHQHWSSDYSVAVLGLVPKQSLNLLSILLSRFHRFTFEYRKTIKKKNFAEFAKYKKYISYATRVFSRIIMWNKVWPYNAIIAVFDFFFFFFDHCIVWLLMYSVIYLHLHILHLRRPAELFGRKITIFGNRAWRCALRESVHSAAKSDFWPLQPRGTCPNWPRHASEPRSRPFRPYYTSRLLIPSTDKSGVRQISESWSFKRRIARQCWGTLTIVESSNQVRKLLSQHNYVATMDLNRPDNITRKYLGVEFYLNWTSQKWKSTVVILDTLLFV